MRRSRLASSFTAAALAAGLAAAVLAPAGAQAAASRAQTAAPRAQPGRAGVRTGPAPRSAGFGNEYANYPAIQSGDQVEVDVQGATFSGPLT